MMKTFDIGTLESAILEAVNKSDKLNRIQKNRLERILTTNWRPRVKKAITDQVMNSLLAEEMVIVSEDGTVTPMFDFDGLIAFLEKLIPLIVSLIGLFG